MLYLYQQIKKGAVKMLLTAKELRLKTMENNARIKKEKFDMLFGAVMPKLEEAINNAAEVGNFSVVVKITADEMADMSFEEVGGIIGRHLFEKYDYHIRLLEKTNEIFVSW